MKQFVPSICLAGIFFIGILVWSLRATPFQFGVVDMQALIFQRAQILAKNNQGKPTQAQIQKMGDQLRHYLSDFADQRGITLLVKGAVIGGNLPDYTDEILNGFEWEESR